MSNSLIERFRNLTERKVQKHGPVRVCWTEGEERLLSFPLEFLLDFIEGNSNLYSEYPSTADEFPRLFLSKGWNVIDVRIFQSNDYSGTKERVEFVLVPK